MTGHAWEDLVAPYALGALGTEEQLSFAEHLAGCVNCRGEVDEFRQVTAMLAYAAPPVAPPTKLRARVLASARQSKQAGRLGSSYAGGTGARAWLPWLAAAASLTAIAAGTKYWTERNERTALAAANAAVSGELAQTRNALAQKERVIGALAGRTVRTAELAATGRPPSARLFWNPERRVMVIAVIALAPAPSGRTYQLWGLTPGAVPVSLGTFDTSPAGTATLALAVPSGLELEHSAVTEEPAGGSAQPTSAPFLVGRWSDSE